MSEVKGTLLGIILAVTVFSIVFGIITVAIKSTSTTVAGKMRDSVQVEPDFEDEEGSHLGYSLTY